MTATEVEPEVTPVVLEAGQYNDMAEEVYHSDPVPGGSLSSGGARMLLPPSCPAKFKWEREHPSPSTKAMNLGSAAHKLVLGRGAEFAVLEYASYQTKAAQKDRDDALAVGKIPLLVAEFLEAEAMAAAVRAHPLAAAIFDPERGGTPEASLFWQDKRTGIWRRARLDWMPYIGSSSRVIIGDLKTTVSSEPEEIAKHCARYRYHQQHPWYRDAVEAIYPGLEARFDFVFVEKTPPYVVTVAELLPADVQYGDDLNQQAIDLYVECTESGVWPGYVPANEVRYISLPRWAKSRDW